MWASPDPILAEYLPSLDTINESIDEEIKIEDKLRGHGGFYNSSNISLYSYVHNRPISYVDPDGNEILGAMNNYTVGLMGKSVGFSIGGAIDDKGGKAHVITFSNGLFAPITFTQPFGISSSITMEETSAATVHDLAGTGSDMILGLPLRGAIGFEGAKVTGQGYTGLTKGVSFGIGASFSGQTVLTHSWTFDTKISTDSFSDLGIMP